MIQYHFRCFILICYFFLQSTMACNGRTCPSPVPSMFVLNTQLNGSLEIAQIQGPAAQYGGINAKQM